MIDSVIACDLGTGGVKSAAFRADGTCIAECAIDYETFYPLPGHHEQRPADWWGAVRDSVRTLTASPDVEASSIGAIGVSGHSLGCVPLDATGALLQDAVPIWSDSRAEREAEAFFERLGYDEWYETTGNGFPAPLYTVFKILWLKHHRPDVYRAAWVVTGTKDYINYRLTGRLATDHSYASGTGVYDLKANRYSERILDAADLDASLFPETAASTDVVGRILPTVAEDLGLPADVQVVAGGVDNSCMALGARTFREGDIFASLGSSSWLTISSASPVLDNAIRPYVFAHVVPGMYVSATSIFSSGTSLDWVCETILPDLVRRARDAGEDVHEALTALAANVPAGSRGLLFVPTLGGGTSLEGGPAARGAFVGLDLGHGREEIMRATLEGIALALRVALDALRTMTAVSREIIVVGGGARSALWRQMFADILECRIVKTTVDQQAAALGAAALAFVGTGLWRDLEPLVALHGHESRHDPATSAKQTVEAMLAAYRVAMDQQKVISGRIAPLRESGRPKVRQEGRQ